MPALPPPPTCRNPKQSSAKAALWTPGPRRNSGIALRTPGRPARAVPPPDPELDAILDAELTEELEADDFVLVEPVAEPSPRDASETMEIAAEDLLAESVVMSIEAPTPTPFAAKAASFPPTSTPMVPAPAPLYTPAPVAPAPAETRSCAPAAVPAVVVPVRELPELPSSVSAMRPATVSESTWSVAALADDDLGFPRRSSWWRYTVVSAGATAVLCCLGFMLAGDPAPVSAAPRDAEPTVVAYDPATLAEPQTDAAVGDPGADDDDEHVLARRIALRGTRNLDAGRTRLAREAFKEALTHDPDCRPALAGLGRIYFAAGRPKTAVEYLAPAVRIEPRDAELQGMLAEAYRAIGHDVSASRHERLAARHVGG